MVQISNFNSILEIGFALNALFYVFEVIPLTENIIDRWMAELERLKKEMDTPIQFPVGFVVGAYHAGRKRTVSIVAVSASLLSLALLIYAAYKPEATCNSFLMALILVIILVPVPVLAWLHVRWYNNFFSMISDGIFQVKYGEIQAKLKENKTAEGTKETIP